MKGYDEMSTQELATITPQDIVENSTKFIEFVEYTKDVETRLKEAWSNVEDAMRTYNIKTLKGDWGTVSLGERKVWRTEMDKLPEQFKKIAVDTTKLNNAFKAGIKVDGTDFTVSEYLTKRIK